MNSNNEKVIDVRPIEENPSFKDVVEFTTDVAVNSIVGVMDGMFGTTKDIVQSGLKICQGETNQASEILKERTQKIATSVVDTAKDTAGLVESSYEAIVGKEDFLTEENKNRLTKVCKGGLFLLLGGTLIDGAK